MISPSLWPTAATTLARTYGLRGAVLRGKHELRRGFGRFRREPKHLLGESGIGPLSSFVVSPEAMRDACNPVDSRTRADLVASGRYQAYRWHWRSLPGDAEAWRTNPYTRFQYTRDDPWWRVSHLSREAGDVKDVWEPARFGWIYDLVRGYLLSGDFRYARAAYDYIAAWAESSPPFLGVHWSCGQETAIRAIALVYAEANFSGAEGITDAQRRLVRDLLAASGERIADAVGYAISQRNNHAISEAAALVILGARFRGVHPEAERWLRQGRKWLVRLVDEQFGTDGWYIQHSFTYLRLALDQCVAAERALRALGSGLPITTTERLCAAGRLLIFVVDAVSGIVPNHGASDGAFVHPITLAEYRDFRPIITAISALFGEPLPEDIPADKEALAWLGAASCLRAPARRDDVRCGASGWAAARIGSAAVFVRAGRYRSRPSHVDPLHLDVRLHGREVVVDPGTFAYNAPPPWRNALVTARVHNGPLLDGEEPGLRGPRFLWLVWPRAQLRTTELHDGAATLVAEIPGRLRRVVHVSIDAVDVHDEALAAGTHALRVIWLLHPDASAADITCSPVGRTVGAAESDALGWFSPRYGERLPSLAVIAENPAGSVIHTRITGQPAPAGADRSCQTTAATAAGIATKR